MCDCCSRVNLCLPLCLAAGLVLGAAIYVEASYPGRAGYSAIFVNTAGAMMIVVVGRATNLLLIQSMPLVPKKYSVCNV